MELSDPEKKILSILHSENRGLNTSEIAKILKSSRQTTGKYLELLRLKKLVFHRKTGPVKLWFEKSNDKDQQLSKVLDDIYKDLNGWLNLRESFRNGQIDRDQYFRKMEEYMKNMRRKLHVQ